MPEATKPASLSTVTLPPADTVARALADYYHQQRMGYAQEVQRYARDIERHDYTDGEHGPIAESEDSLRSALAKLRDAVENERQQWSVVEGKAGYRIPKAVADAMTEPADPSPS